MNNKNLDIIFNFDISKYQGIYLKNLIIKDDSSKIIFLDTKSSEEYNQSFAKSKYGLETIKKHQI